MRKRYLPRSAPDIRPHAPLKARRAAATARSTSASEASVTSARTSSVAGLIDLKAEPPSVSVNSPLMKSP